MHESEILWIKTRENGRVKRESTETPNRVVARRMLRAREGDVEKGIPIIPKMGRVTFDEAATDLLNDYRANGKRSLDDVQGRITNHLAPVFHDRRLIGITTADVRAYVAGRLAAGAVHGTLNRELSALKRMFSLTVKAGLLHKAPAIEKLHEDNVRQGFFERASFEAVRDHLPHALQPVVEFAHLTGWRMKSEILPLEWRQVDWAGREVRLDPGTTKNREGRSFPFTAALEALLTDQRAELCQSRGLPPQGLIRGLMFSAPGVKPPGPR